MKSGEKCLKVGKSAKKWGKVRKSGEKTLEAFRPVRSNGRETSLWD